VTEFALGNALEAGPLVVGFNAALGGRAFREQALEHPPRNPDHAAVFADLNPELHGLPLGVPAGVLWNDGWETVPLALSCPVVRSDEVHIREGAR
jgi:hypothetical protein